MSRPSLMKKEAHAPRIHQHNEILTKSAPRHEEIIATLNLIIKNLVKVREDRNFEFCYQESGQGKRRSELLLTLNFVIFCYQEYLESQIW